MKKILFFAVMFCVALSTAMLVSCGGDDDEDEPTPVAPNIFKSSITIPQDVLDIYKDIKVTYTFADGTQETEDVTNVKITKECKLKEVSDVVVSFTGTLRSDVVEDDKSYSMTIIYSGSLDNYSLNSMFGTTKLGKLLKDKYQNLGDNAGFKKHTYSFTQPINE